MVSEYNPKNRGDRTDRSKVNAFNPIGDLAENEKMEGESAIHWMSQFRSYIIGSLIVVAGISLAFENIPLVIGSFVAIFLLYVSSLDSVAKLVKTLTEALIGLYFILIVSNAVANIGTTLKTIEGAGAAGATASGLTSLFSPSSAISQFMPWIGSGMAYLGGYVQLAAGIIIVGGFVTIIASYLYTKGQRIYYTDRRIIITKRFGGSSTFQTTIDSLSDISSNSGLIGRIFGFGAIYVTNTSGSGVYERDQEGRPRPGRALQRVKLTADGVKEADKIANDLAKLRMEYMDSLHLKEIKEYVKRTAEAVSGKSSSEEDKFEPLRFSEGSRSLRKKKRRFQDTDQSNESP